MSLRKANKIARYSLALSVIRAISGPFTLFLLTLKLNSEELGFYYAFYGVVGLKNLFEAGMQNVIKLNFSEVSHQNIERIRGIFLFSFFWYLGIAVVSFFLIYNVGRLYFRDYQGVIVWELPWLLLCISSSLILFLSVIESYLDGMQFQIELKLIQIASSSSVVFLWAGIYMGLNLYSIALMQFASIIVLVAGVYLKRNIFNTLLNKVDEFRFNDYFKEFFPLLKRIVTVWFFGYFLWNGFNLISFKLMSPESAGIIGLTFALAKAGQQICTSIILGQTTLFSNLISKGKSREARSISTRFICFSTFILLIGYLAFLIIREYIDVLMSKTLPFEECATLFLFFILMHIYSSLNCFVRAHKIEPFVYSSILVTCFSLIGFVYSIYNDILLFLVPAITVLVATFWSLYLYQSNLKK
ncbi:hypothetical protein BCT04_16145 [Vibrio breoganii]|uniref:hypothetical protein n=1 Tax=Vibrio breoganii TaxID=553239 RepID=UPI000C8399D7|nr:hypothetical protein [Vibrio breoganii]PMO63059.1 hypothetical protein BCT04_16145 [Vibrio breoganii]